MPLSGVVVASAPYSGAPTAARPMRERALRLAAAFVFVIGPAAGCVVMLLRWRDCAPSQTDVAVICGFYAFTMLGLTAGFHRLFSHRSFRAHPVVQVVLGIAGSMAAQGPIVRWVAQHRRHHAVADRPGDPHSPAASGTGLLALLRGLWHAHVGWMFRDERVLARRFAPDLVASRLVSRIDALYWLWLVASLGLPAALDGFICGSLADARSGLLWGGVVRIFLVHHATWSVNSLGHSMGSRPFLTADRSTNNAVVALLTFGEGWHNNHHASPGSAEHGFRWWQVDVTAWMIRALEALGLVSCVHRRRRGTPLAPPESGSR
jgi:stearoyl-CoA desaturase (Delta-9 desaturase)